MGIDLLNDEPNHAESGLQDRLTEACSSLQTLSKSRLWMEAQYVRITKAMFWLFALLTLSIVLNVLQFIFTPDPVYFAQTPDLRLTEMTPIDKPRSNDEGVVQWTVDQVGATLSIDFLHWQSDLMKVKGSYTDKAFNSLVISLRETGIIDMLEKRREVINMVVTAAPIIEAKGAYTDGRLAWKIKFPVTVSYETSQGIANTQYMSVEAVVVRVPVDESPVGVKIDQLILKPSTSNEKN